MPRGGLSTLGARDDTRTFTHAHKHMQWSWYWLLLIGAARHSPTQAVRVAPHCQARAATVPVALPCPWPLAVCSESVVAWGRCHHWQWRQGPGVWGSVKQPETVPIRMPVGRTRFSLRFDSSRFEQSRLGYIRGGKSQRAGFVEAD